MTKLAKVLVFFALAASIAFLGFAWVAMMGGPNWNAEAGMLENYGFQKEEGVDGKWTVKDRTTGESVAIPAGSVEASAVLAARRDLKKKQDAELAKLKEETGTYQKRLADAKSQNDADLKALEARVKVLDGQWQALNAKILSLSNDVVKRSQEAQVLRAEATRRREDVYRLTRELEEIRADNYRADQLQTKLQDQLVRLQGAIASLEDRNKQLRAEAPAPTP